jgi:hypothetical protein
MIYVRTKLKRGGGIWGAAHKPTKKKHMGEIQLNPQREGPSSHTIIEQEINTRPEKRKRKQVIDRITATLSENVAHSRRLSMR